MVPRDGKAHRQKLLRLRKGRTRYEADLRGRGGLAGAAGFNFLLKLKKGRPRDTCRKAGVPRGLFTGLVRLGQ